MPLEYGDPSRLDGRLEALAPALGLALTAAERQRAAGLHGADPALDQGLQPDRPSATPARCSRTTCWTAWPSSSPLRRHRRGRAGRLRVLDVGSGAGLPGVILAMLNPAWQVDLRRRGREEGRLHPPSRGRAGPAQPSRRPRPCRGARHLQDARVRPDHLARLRVDPGLHHADPAAAGTARPMGRHEGQPVRGGARAIPADVEMFHVEQLDVPELNEKRCLVWLEAPAITLTERGA